jgi:Lon protease-like protein
MATETVTVPIFPLPNLVFFPETLLPLHIFEPRYKTMIADVLAGDRQLGIVQLRPGWDKDYYGTPPVYKHLTVGTVIRDNRLADGRYDVLVRGCSAGAHQERGHAWPVSGGGGGASCGIPARG